VTSPSPIGTRAPEFRAPSSHGQTLDLASFHGKVPVVLIFASDRRRVDLLRRFDDHLVEFGHRRIQVLAVVPEIPKQVRARAERDGLSLPLLADADGSIAESFGAAGDEAFVVGTDGIIEAVVPVRDGPEALLARLEDRNRGIASDAAAMARTLDQAAPDRVAPLPQTEHGD
jgi:peroxiredoxin